MRREARQLNNEKIIEKKIVYILYSSVFVSMELQIITLFLNKREIK